MNRTRHRIAALAPVSAIALLAGCAAHSGSTHSADPSAGHRVSSGTTAGKVRNGAVDSGATVTGTPTPTSSGTGDRQASATANPTPVVQPPASTPAPEFRSTTVYGLARKVTLTKDGAELVWDKADWQFNAPGADRNGMDSCHTFDHGDVLTNCNAKLRTTDIPAGTPVKLVFPGCPAGGPDIVPDPRHADRALGDASVSLTEFAHVMNGECQPNYPGPTVGGLWLTFDDAGKLTAVTEKFES